MSIPGAGSRMWVYELDNVEAEAVGPSMFIAATADSAAEQWIIDQGPEETLELGERMLFVLVPGEDNHAPKGYVFRIVRPTTPKFKIWPGTGAVVT